MWAGVSGVCQNIYSGLSFPFKDVLKYLRICPWIELRNLNKKRTNTFHRHKRESKACKWRQYNFHFYLFLVTVGNGDIYGYLFRRNLYQQCCTNRYTKIWYCITTAWMKHRKNCKCCPVSLSIVMNQVLTCQKCRQCIKCHKSLGLSLLTKW